jgi:hypothetical protein
MCGKGRQPIAQSSVDYFEIPHARAGQKGTIICQNPASR